jgi:hypothetical protein
MPGARHSMSCGYLARLFTPGPGPGLNPGLTPGLTHALHPRLGRSDHPPTPTAKMCMAFMLSPTPWLTAGSVTDLIVFPAARDTAVAYTLT